MADELADAAKQHAMDEILADRLKLLPRRCCWMPTRSAIQKVDDRFCPGGIAGLFAVARGHPYNDFLIPLHIRSPSVAENRGFASVSFNGYHQWFVHRTDESHLRWTIFRELYEEVFGGEEVCRPSKRVKHDWYFDKPFIDYFHDQADQVVSELVGFGFNGLVGNWECAVLLMVRDIDYWVRFGSRMQYNWEAESVIPASTKNTRDWQEALRMRWAGDSLLCLLRGLRRLSEVDPNRFGFSIDDLATLGC